MRAGRVLWGYGWRAPQRRQNRAFAESDSPHPTQGCGVGVVAAPRVELDAPTGPACMTSRAEAAHRAAASPEGRRLRPASVGSAAGRAVAKMA